jgi:choline-sulfatase
VHYNDPHAPYAPPEPYRTEYAKQPYLGEVAAMDAQLGRLIQAWDARVPGPRALIVVADHGEALGEHGELQHGDLLYQATMHVPLVIAGPGVTPGSTDTPVSTRRVYNTILDWANVASAHSLRKPEAEVVLGEAMEPFLEYGWQPQVMAVAGHDKLILAGRIESYDLTKDSAEAHDLGDASVLPDALRNAARDYPVPGLEAAAEPTAPLSAEDRQKLASLGYVGSTATPEVRKDAPRPADMTRLFPVLTEASELFVGRQFTQVIPLFEQVLAVDKTNLDAMLLLGASYSALGQNAKAVDMFQRAQALAPRSPDVRLYLALHYARSGDWDKAGPMLEQAIAQMPERLPALEALASMREAQGRLDDAISLWQRVYALRETAPDEWLHLGQMAMAAGATDAAIQAFEAARAQQGSTFAHHLELGVLYQAAGRLTDARDALDRVPASDPGYPMALFKRAQVSVLLHEPDASSRIDAARRHADQTTRQLIANEKLFQGK